MTNYRDPVSSFNISYKVRNSTGLYRYFIITREYVWKEGFLRKKEENEESFNLSSLTFSNVTEIEKTTYI